MPFDFEQWKAWIANRSDITSMVTHLTKPTTDGAFSDENEINKAATTNLIKITFWNFVQPIFSKKFMESPSLRA